MPQFAGQEACVPSRPRRAGRLVLGRAVQVLLALALSSGAAYAQRQCSDADIAAKVCVLSRYSPDPSGADVGPLRCSSGAGFTPQVVAAFQIAPDDVANDVCSLHNIVVLPGKNTVQSWGKWEDPTYYQPPRCRDSLGNPLPCSFVGIGEGVFARGLALVHDDRLPGPGKSFIKHGHSPANIPSRTLGVLATLAHEVGHIKFRRNGVRRYVCFQSDIVGPSWSDDGGRLPPETNTYSRRWLPFGTEIGAHGSGPGRIVPMPGQVSRPADVEAIYTSGFATLLASSSPEEDFVESYALYAVLNAKGGPGALRAQIGGTTGRQITLDLGRGDSTGDAILARKLACH